MAYSLHTDSFLNAFYRMVSRHGLPSIVISDNVTNFVSADRELKELVADLDKLKDSRLNSRKRSQVVFQPPRSTTLHEKMIKAAKRAIKNILGDADVTD